jgi:competence transcription factor ComK
MINYIINTQLGTKIYQENGIKYEKYTNLTYIKKLCLEAMFSYEGYLKAVKKIYKFKYKIPVYINNSLMFIQTKRARDYDNIWINYASIKDIKCVEEFIEIIFYNNEMIQIKYAFHKFKLQIKYLEEIRNTKVKHFHRK